MSASTHSLQTRSSGSRVLRSVQLSDETSHIKDQFETEADQVADQIVKPNEAKNLDNSMTGNHSSLSPIMGNQISTVQDKVGESIDNEETIVQKPKLLQMSANPDAPSNIDKGHSLFDRKNETKQLKKVTQIPQFEKDQVFENISDQLKESKGSGSQMNPILSQEMSDKFGADFSDVRIHTNSRAVQMNNELGAKAFAHGQDIYFNEGRYKPESSEGKHLLAHELTHVQQQSGLTGQVIQKKPDDKTVNNATLIIIADDKIQLYNGDNLVSEFPFKIEEGVNVRIQFYAFEVPEDANYDIYAKRTYHLLSSGEGIISGQKGDHRIIIEYDDEVSDEVNPLIDYKTKIKICHQADSCSPEKKNDEEQVKSEEDAIEKVHLSKSATDYINSLTDQQIDLLLSLSNEQFEKPLDLSQKVRLWQSLGNSESDKIETFLNSLSDDQKAHLGMLMMETPSVDGQTGTVEPATLPVNSEDQKSIDEIKRLNELMGTDLLSEEHIENMSSFSGINDDSQDITLLNSVVNEKISKYLAGMTFDDSIPTPDFISEMIFDAVGVSLSVLNSLVYGASEQNEKIGEQYRGMIEALNDAKKIDWFETAVSLIPYIGPLKRLQKLEKLLEVLETFETIIEVSDQLDEFKAKVEGAVEVTQLLAKYKKINAQLADENLDDFDLINQLESEKEKLIQQIGLQVASKASGIMELFHLPEDAGPQEIEELLVNIPRGLQVFKKMVGYYEAVEKGDQDSLVKLQSTAIEAGYLLYPLVGYFLSMMTDKINEYGDNSLIPGKRKKRKQKKKNPLKNKGEYDKNSIDVNLPKAMTYVRNEVIKDPDATIEGDSQLSYSEKDSDAQLSEKNTKISFSTPNNLRKAIKKAVKSFNKTERKKYKAKSKADNKLKSVKYPKMKLSDWHNSESGEGITTIVVKASVYKSKKQEIGASYLSLQNSDESFNKEIESNLKTSFKMMDEQHEMKVDKDGNDKYQIFMKSSKFEILRSRIENAIKLELENKKTIEKEGLLYQDEGVMSDLETLLIQTNDYYKTPAFRFFNEDKTLYGDNDGVLNKSQKKGLERAQNKKLREEGNSSDVRFNPTIEVRKGFESLKDAIVAFADKYNRADFYEVLASIEGEFLVDTYFDLRKRKSINTDMSADHQPQKVLMDLLKGVKYETEEGKKKPLYNNSDAISRFTEKKGICMNIHRIRHNKLSSTILGEERVRDTMAAVFEIHFEDEWDDKQKNKRIKNGKIKLDEDNDKTIEVGRKRIKTIMQTVISDEKKEVAELYKQYNENGNHKSEPSEHPKVFIPKEIGASTPVEAAQKATEEVKKMNEHAWPEIFKDS